MAELPYLFSTGVFFCTAVFLLIRKTLPAFKFLGVGAVLLSYISFVSFLIVSGRILDWPHLFRTQSPLQYLVGPIGLWTALWLVRPELTWKKVQYLHLIPFLLHALELLPFYSLSAEEKIAIYREYIRLGYEGTGHGIFSYRFHAFFKSGHLLVYTLAWAYLLRKVVSQSVTRPLQPLFVWISMDIILKTLATGSIFLANFGKVQESLIGVLGHSLFFFDGMLSAFFLLVYPKISIEPLELPSRGVKAGDRGNSTADTGFTAEAEKWANQVDGVLERHYRNPGLDADTIAGHLFMSRRHLHRVSRQYSIGTPMKRLLELRLEKGYEQIIADPGKPLTSIALEIGFSSPALFSAHFKNRYGMLPSEFQQQCKNI